MFLDLRDRPDEVWFHELGRKVNQWDLTRFVCEPPLQVMTFYSPFLPWYVEARSSNPSGLTLEEMFRAIWQCMQMPITNEDWYNTEMDDLARAKIGDAWDVRCGDNMAERQKGVKRVDFLMGRVVMEGLLRGRDGMFELKLKKGTVQ